MIGNDIIDLDLAHRESNWQRRGFLDKLFTEYEKACILSSEDPEIMVWHLWSRKEAVYKIYNRLTGIRAFIPLKIECVGSETVICDGKKYQTKTEITADFIHSMAVSQKAFFPEMCSLDRKDIVKHNKIPFAKNGNAASISHHGRFERIIAIQ